MRAVVYGSFGGPEVLEVATLPIPRKLEAHEILIRVQSAALNPVDWKIMSGRLNNIQVFKKAIHPSKQTPSQLGLDMSGIIVAVGKNVSRLKMHDQVK